MSACFRDVALARAKLGEARSARPGVDVRGLRSDLLTALEAYQAALEAIGSPTPPPIQREITLYKQLRGRQ